MSSDTYNGTDYCYDARWNHTSVPTNADVDGIVVAATSVTIHLCLRILITWSPESLDEGIKAILLQVYSTLLSTLWSVGRKQLSLFDAQFALNVTSSPLMIYLSFASVCNLLGFKTGLYKRVASNHLITSVFGASVILFWFALDAILTLSDSAFIDSAACKGQTFVNLLHNLCRFLLGYFTDPGSMVIIVLSICLLVPLMFFVAMLHRRASKEAWSYRQGKSKPWVWFYVPWMFMKSYWYILNRDWEWYIYLIFIYIDFFWAGGVIGSAVYASEGGYVLSYGQALSVFSAVPYFITTAAFVVSHRRDIRHYVLHKIIPRHIFEGNHHPPPTDPTPASPELRELSLHGDPRVGSPGSSMGSEPQRNSPTPPVAGDPAHSRGMANTESVELTQRVHTQSCVNTSERNLSAIPSNGVLRNTTSPTPQRSWTYG